MPFYTVNADGSGLKQLPVPAGTLAPSPQRVISDNGLVVFTNTNVYLMNLDGGNIRNLTNYPDNPPVSASNATISADGSTVVFESTANLSTNSGTGPIQIWTVRSDGSAPRQLTFSADAATRPSVAADGNTVAFLQSGQIQVIRTYGKSLSFAATDLTLSVPQSPVISGDASSIVFLAGPSAGQPGAVYQVNTDGTNLHPIFAPRAISPAGVTSAAYGAALPSSGSLVSIYGINFLPLDGLLSAVAFPLPKVLAGISVAANGIQLPLVSVSPWQINAQLPQNMPAMTTSFQVSGTDGSTTPPVVTPVVRNGPALFTYPSGAAGSPFDQAAAFHAGTATPADADHPASPGETLEMYGVGLGPTDPAVEAGLAAPSNPVAQAVEKPNVLIGNQPATVMFAGLVPGLAGVYQVNAIVPMTPLVPSFKPGFYTVQWRTADTVATSTGLIAVK